MSHRTIEIAGRSLSLANLDKDLYPAYGFTKAQILDYYRRVAPFILPHVKDRALTLKRYPEGVGQDFFFEKRCPAHRPDWVPTARLKLDKSEPMTVCLVNNLETLIWVANLACLELHVPLARVDAPDTPDAVVFDLDPGEPATILECARVALILRHLFQNLGLAGFVKTSGRKGLHVWVPLNHPDATFADTKRFSQGVAETLQKHYPDLVTARMAREFRRGKVFINWEQNDPARTTVAVYSLRAGDRPTVSFPLSWPELEQAAGEGDPEKLQIIPAEAVRRVETRGDLFQEVLLKQQKLPFL